MEFLWLKRVVIAILLEQINLCYVPLEVKKLYEKPEEISRNIL